jgi:hypothetical protein
MKKVTEYNDMEVILHYDPEKGHKGLSLQTAVNFLYKVLGET